MAVENTANTIAELNPLYPRDRDYLYEGASHIRLIKQTLKNTFPNVTEPVNVDSDTFKIISEKLKFTGDAMDVGGLMIKNGQAGTGTNDFVTKGQMDAMFDRWMQQKIYRVGAYYVTEEDINPGDSISLGFGSWTKVTGVIMGAGIVNPDGSVPNAQRVEFVAGGEGGRVFNTVRPDNLPLTTVSVSGNTSQNTHHHVRNLANVRLSIDDRNFYVESVDGRYPNNNPRNDSDVTHDHTFTGSGTFGRDDISRQPINTLPPFRSAYIWRRIS